VAAFCVTMTVGKGAMRPPSPDTRIATAPASGRIATKTQPRPRPAGGPFGEDQPSDPRPGILPRGRAGWPECCVPVLPGGISMVRVLARAGGPMVCIGSLVRSGE
jgi:hypothetical protein